MSDTRRQARATTVLTRTGALGATTALSLLLVLTACGGGGSGSMDHSSMSSSAPSSASSSSPASSPSSGATSSTAVDAEHDEHDVVFAQQMVVHHEGAIEMAEAAATRASSQEVRDLAAAIASAQQPEIDRMTSWLTAWGEPVEAGSSTEGVDHSSMGHSSMPETMTEEQMSQLSSATGADFDRLFLRMMIEHHTGAVQMAETEQQQGVNPQARELAGSIATSQDAEIDRMEQLLSALG